MNDSTILENVREDDFIEYHLFPKVDNPLGTEEQLDELLKKCNEIVAGLTEGHIWHRDEFSLSTIIPDNLNPTIPHQNSKTPHLYGVVHHGENMEDEWLIVYLLLELTKKIPDLVAKVSDVDGEFLLIEAAESLPEWIKPNVAANRVYLYNGKVHIIDLSTVKDGEVDIVTAIESIRKNPTKTEANSSIQQSIANRIKNYPHKIKENLHTAKVYVPIGVAVILNREPNLISSAVHAFFNRDVIDIKTCRAMKFFPPENRVKTNITFSKCMYAMLNHSKFVPDKITGWNLPLINNSEYKSHTLGMKVACGFEILASQAKQNQDLETNKSWQKYLKSLRDRNYFDGFLEHSDGYKNLLNKAKEYFINHYDSMYSSSVKGRKTLELMNFIELDSEEIKNLENNLPPEDDDSWLNVSSEELDQYLMERYGQKKILSLNNNSDAPSLSQKISTFLNHVSDVDGAEFPNVESPVRPPRNKKNKGKNKVSFSQNAKNDESAQKPQINFDPGAFSSAIQNILNFVIPEDNTWNSESDCDMSDYEDDNFVQSNSYENIKTKMQSYMNEMDKELASTTIGESFIKKTDESFDDIENFDPVDIDMNALKNILESYKSQFGEAGPSSNMLGPMGVHLDVSEEKL